MGLDVDLLKDNDITSSQQEVQTDLKKFNFTIVPALICIIFLLEF